MSSIDKTLARVRSRIHENEYYEAHQAARTVVARLLRSKKYSEAIGLLYGAILLLAEAGQQGSACDLTLYMLDVYEKADVRIDAVSRGQLAEIVWHLDGADPAVKQIAAQARNWSVRCGSLPGGDSELNHVFGLQLARGNQYSEAEKFLLLGVRDSAIALARFHAHWALIDREKAPMIVSRGVFGYLSIENIRNAHAYLATFLSQILESSDEPVLKYEDVFVFEDDPVYVFFQLLVQVCQTKNANLYRRLSDWYNPQKVESWKPALEKIERNYFNIVHEKPANLMDIMGGLLR